GFTPICTARRATPRMRPIGIAARGARFAVKRCRPNGRRSPPLCSARSRESVDPAKSIFFEEFPYPEATSFYSQRPASHHLERGFVHEGVSLVVLSSQFS